MVARVDIGQRDVGGIGLSISAPGEDVRNPNSRLIFSSDARYAQILFEGDIALASKKENGSPYPGSSVPTRITTGYGRWFFPRVLAIRPFCRLTYTYRQDSQQRFFFGVGAVSMEERTIMFAPQTDSVELFFRHVRTNDTTSTDLVAHIAVLNISVDG